MQDSAIQSESGDKNHAPQVFYPVKKDEFSQLGTGAQLQVAIALTNHGPDPHDFDNFPNPSQKEIEAAKAKAEAEARAIEEQKLKEEAALIEAQKPKVKSTTKVEQVSTVSNEVIHVWASAEDAAAVMVRDTAYFNGVLEKYMLAHIGLLSSIANTLKRHPKAVERCV